MILRPVKNLIEHDIIRLDERLWPVDRVVVDGDAVTVFLARKDGSEKVLELRRGDMVALLV